MIRVLQGCLIATVIAFLAAVAYENWRPSSSHPVPDLPPLPIVTLTGVDAAVAAQISNARQTVEASPNEATANGRLGALLEIYHYPEAALACYERAALLSRADFEWRYHLGRMQHALGDPVAAATTLGNALLVRPGYPPALCLQGEALLEQGRLSNARKAFEMALAQSPRSIDAQLGVGKVLAAAGEHETAVERLQRALTLAPRYKPLHYTLALSFRALGRTDEARRHFELAREGETVSPDPDPLLSQVYDLEIGLDSDYRKAKRLINGGENVAAEALLTAIIEASPEHYGAHGALGQALQRQGRLDEALSHFERAIELNPTSIDYLRPASVLLVQQNRLDEAEKHMQSVLARGGDHADDHHVLGVVLLKRGRIDEAIETLTRALELNPHHDESRAALVQALTQKVVDAASDQEAIPFLRRLSVLAPNELNNWTILGQTLSDAGQLEEAVKAFDKALELRPGFDEVVRRRDVLLERLGRPPTASKPL